MDRRGRPYTEKQLEKLKCHCCGKPAKFQWNACADHNVWRPLCPRCDVLVNIGVLKVLYPTDWEWRIELYCVEIGYNYEELKDEQEPKSTIHRRRTPASQRRR